MADRTGFLIFCNAGEPWSS